MTLFGFLYLRQASGIIALAAMTFWAMPAGATLGISMAIVDFADPARRVADIEVENRGKDRLYVTVEASLIANPGTATERRVQEQDPEKLGLLVTPARLVLEPGERKLVRFALTGDPGAQDRIFRVLIKPVVGKIKSETTAIKVLLGFDVLVIQRPAQAQAGLVAQRQGGFLVFRNTGNTNVLLFDGKQCAQRCQPMEAKRIYAGAEWRVRINGAAPVTYKVQTGGKLELGKF